MHLLFDARLYGLAHAGIGRYIKNVLTALWQADRHKEVHYSLLLDQAHYSSLPVPKNVTKVLATPRHYSLSEQLYLPRLIHQLGPDLVHIPHFNVPLLLKQPFVVTIHDILWHTVRGSRVTTLPKPLYHLKYLGYQVSVKHAVTHARQIITPSQFVSDQLHRTYPDVPPTRFRVIPEAVDPAFFPVTKPSRLTLKTPALVYTGSLYPHKNLEVVFSALTLLLAQGQPLHLYLISARNIFSQRTHDLVTQRQLLPYVHFLGFVPDDQLVSLYRQALALVQPSISEGFGLTGLEAMAARLPVIAARAGAMPEVYGDQALFFDPHDPQSLCDHIQTLIRDHDRRQDLIERGLRHSQGYSWAHTARLTLQTYHQAMTGSLPQWL